ncbi:MAG: hypothetical protein HYY16_19610 [Planctomycetes bacterium]|nr:hypothetical protein [Planctomycetota bacterium]
MNVLRIQKAPDPRDPRRRRLSLVVDGRAIEDRIVDELRRLQGQPWSERKDAEVSLEALRAGLERPGPHELLVCRGCEVSGDLGLRFVVDHDGDRVRWTIAHVWRKPEASFSYVFHRPQVEAELARVEARQ